MISRSNIASKPLICATKIVGVLARQVVSADNESFKSRNR
jgi:hypothetical protein